MSYAIVSGLTVSGTYLLLSLGFMVMLRIADIPNLSHGAFVAGGMYLVILLVNDLGLPYGLAVPVACLAGLIPCALIYEGVLRPVHSEGHRPQIVFTLLLLSALQAVYQLAFGSDVTSLNIHAEAWNIAGVAIQREQVIAFVVAVTVCAAMLLFFRFTKTGKLMEVTGKYPEGAMAIGVPVQRVFRLVFLIGSAMALLAGALLVSTTPASPFVGLEYLVIAVVIAIGARLSFAGAVAAAILYGVGYQLLLQVSGNPAVATIAIYAAFILVIGTSPLVGTTLRRSRPVLRSEAPGRIS